MSFLLTHGVYSVKRYVLFHFQVDKDFLSLTTCHFYNKRRLLMHHCDDF